MTLAKKKNKRECELPSLDADVLRCRPSLKVKKKTRKKPRSDDCIRRAHRHIRKAGTRSGRLSELPAYQRKGRFPTRRCLCLPYTPTHTYTHTCVFLLHFPTSLFSYFGFPLSLAYKSTHTHTQTIFSFVLLSGARREACIL